MSFTAAVEKGGIDLKLRVKPVATCDFSYRRSYFYETPIRSINWHRCVVHQGVSKSRSCLKSLSMYTNSILLLVRRYLPTRVYVCTVHTPYRGHTTHACFIVLKLFYSKRHAHGKVAFYAKINYQTYFNVRFDSNLFNY